MIVSVVYFILYFSLFLVLLALHIYNHKPHAYSLTTYPRISILIAARNEEHTIIKCLEALEQLDFPKDKVEILIGDDSSTDKTRVIVDAFIKGKPQYTCVTITQNIGDTKGKANVLAHLAKLATSDFFLYTDADIVVHQSWAKSMLSAMQQGVGIVTGITTVRGCRLFDHLQAMDWLFSLGLMQVVADLKLPVSTMGNNMLIRREAYESVGGFESIKFSVTEDVAIFKQLVKQGWNTRNIYDESVLALSAPADNLLQLMQQRKRWMRGSMHLPLYMVIIFILHSAYYPILLPFFAYTSFSVMLAIFCVKLLLQSLYLNISLKRIQRQVPWWLYILFELYLVFTSIALIIYFFLPLKIRWKGRNY
ncbi:glycosyltransferase [Pontibacter harenae]|uniref:glycosyltransferase n=1 Tax=Pontibacter harenae TaxID=2894083 RepID=UPI001E58724D|nr:glycosyltransferase [Pontibacter harenae]MCC9165642.1 glycosyltransferase [Pontibacter harenae]